MKQTDLATISEAGKARAQEIFAQQQLSIWRRTDRLFACLMVIQWIGAILEALILSPLAWSGTQSQVHIHVWAAVILGGIITVFPVFLALTRPGYVVTRHVIALGQMLMSALLIHLSGGRIETHFHVFASLAFLAFYRDWKVLVTASAVVALDHGLRGLFWPQSVYGLSIVQPYRWIEHTAWVAFEDIFLIVLCLQSLQEMRKSAFREAGLEETNLVRDQAVEATKLKSAFVANISHELRTPLSAVLGLNDLLLDTKLNEEQKELAGLIKDSARSLSVIVNDILDLSKIEANKMNLEMVEFNPVAIVHECTQLLTSTALAKGILISCNIEPRIPSVVVGDPVRIHQILINLIGNAVKFTDKGTITVRAVIEAEDEKQLTIKFAVSDTGIGLSDAEKQLLFLPFSQVDDSTTRKYAGSGLGLAICKRLVALMHGEIGVVTAKGSGSTFWFTVPFERASRAIAPHAESTAQTVRLTGTQVILVVEDNSTLQLLATRQISSLGYQCRAVGSGQEALNELSQHKYSLVLMDCHLPDFDGFEVTRRIRQLETGSNKHIPIIALTADAMTGSREKCLNSGMDGYLGKPHTTEELKEVIDQFLAPAAANGTLLNN